MPEIDVETTRRTQLVDVTEEVQDALAVEDGAVAVFSRHTTAGVLVNENESGLVDDLETFYERLVPEASYEHDRIDGNADSHLRASLVGPGETIPVADGRLDLGTWQSVFLAEFDGPRSRTLVVKPV